MAERSQRTPSRYDWQGALQRPQPWSPEFVEDELRDWLKAASGVVDPPPSFDPNDEAIRRDLPGRFDWQRALSAEQPWQADDNAMFELLLRARDALDARRSREETDPDMTREYGELSEPDRVRSTGIPWERLTREVAHTLEEPAGTRSLHQSKVPLTGFLGPQRTRTGTLATVLNLSVNLDGQEWVIPMLTPNQDPQDLLDLLSDRPLPGDVQRRMEDRAIEFAIEEERRNPGTFARYPTAIEATAAAQGASAGKGALPPLPQRTPPYPGRQ